MRGRYRSRFQLRKPGSSHASFQPRNATSTFEPWCFSSLPRRSPSSYGHLGGRDARDRNVLDEDVRSLEDEAADALAAVERGMNERDRATVGVTDEDRRSDPELVEESREEGLALFVHIRERARERDGIGGAVAEAAVGDRVVSRGLGDARREIAPLLRRPEALVQKDEDRRGALACVAVEVDDLDPLAEHLHDASVHARSL